MWRLILQDVSLTLVAQIVYGWNCAALEAAIIAAVQSTYYNGNLQVNFIRRSRKIHVRADNWLSRALSQPYDDAQYMTFVMWDRAAKSAEQSCVGAL